MKVNDRSAGRQCDSEGVIEVSHYAGVGNCAPKYYLYFFKTIILCGMNERRTTTTTTTTTTTFM